VDTWSVRPVTRTTLPANAATAVVLAVNARLRPDEAPR